MQPNYIEMKRERHAALQAADAILARAEADKRNPTEAENALIGEHMATVKRLNPKIEEREALSTLPKMVRDFGPEILFGGSPGPKSQPQGNGSPRRASTLQEAMQYASAEQLEEIKSFARYLGGDMTALADLTPGGDGSIFIPTTVAGVVERNIAAFTPVINNCRVWPTVISDSEPAVILAPAALTGADATISGDHPPTALGGPTMGAYKFSSQPVFIPRETLTDSSMAVLDEIMYALLGRILRTQNLKFTKGTGSGEPTGFLHDATAYSAGAVPLDLDIALDLAYSVPPLYRPNGIYMASDTTIKYLRKLKTGISGDKRNLWKDVFEEGNATLGTPAKLHGYPCIVNNDLDSVASDGTFAAVSPLVFGDFKRFVVRAAEMGSPYIYRFPVPAKDGGAAIAFQRSDSKLVVSTAISKLTV
jgi:HK97 family phage major capsid protein